MFDLAHLGDEVGVVDQGWWGVTPGQDDVHPGSAAAQHIEHLVQVEPAEGEAVGDLVENDDVVLAAFDALTTLGPALAASTRSCSILALPG
jgi:hypothetical protein